MLKMNRPLIACIPNISEGRNLAKVATIAEAVTTVSGVRLLHTDIGKSANRSVITFVGEPEKVIEAAFRLIKKTNELIDLRNHLGTHPRIGATDVCPLIPIANITIEQTVVYAHKLGEKVGEELGISGYFYEYSARNSNRKKLENIRAGQYEGLKQKLKDPDWQPDFGPITYNDTVMRSGIMAIAARDFLIAYNVNLNTTNIQKAKRIAARVRESGSVKKVGRKVVRIPGKLKSVKGIGWYIKEYGIAQVSYNLTDINTTSIAQVFEQTQREAAKEKVTVTGSEIIGLVPLKALLDTADYFLSKQERFIASSEQEKIVVALKSLGLNDVKPFYPKERIIEYCIK